MRKIAVVILLALSSTVVKGQEHFYRDKKWWAGEAVIVATGIISGVAENHARDGGTYAFGNKTSSSDVAAIEVVAFGAFTGLHVLNHYAFTASDKPLSKPWAILAYGAVPVSEAVWLLPQARGNYIPSPNRAVPTLRCGKLLCQ